MPPRKIPEIEIPFLPGDEPWQVINASNPRQYDRSLAQEEPQRRLISWLTLPMAAEVVNSLLVVPMEIEADEAGRQIIHGYFLHTELDKHIAKTQKTTRSGSATPPFIHCAIDPENPHHLSILIPTAQLKTRHAVLSLAGEYKAINKRSEGDMDISPVKVTIARQQNKTINLHSMGEKLEIPGDPTSTPTEEGSELPVSPRRYGREKPTVRDWRIT